MYFFTLNLNLCGRPVGYVSMCGYIASCKYFNYLFMRLLPASAKYPLSLPQNDSAAFYYSGVYPPYAVIRDQTFTLSFSLVFVHFLFSRYLLPLFLIPCVLFLGLHVFEIFSAICNTCRRVIASLQHCACLLHT